MYHWYGVMNIPYCSVCDITELRLYKMLLICHDEIGKNVNSLNNLFVTRSSGMYKCIRDVHGTNILNMHHDYPSLLNGMLLQYIV